MGALAWRIVNLLQMTIVVSWTALCIVLALALLLVGRGPELPFALTRRVWPPVGLRVFGVRLEVHGLEHVDRSRPQVFVSNHRSNLDAAVIYSAIPRDLRFLAKQELRRVPLLGWFIAAMGMVFVDRESRASALESLRRGAVLLSEGHALLSFPEATRNLELDLRPFKCGIFGLSIAAGAEIVPIALRGTDSVWPPGGFALRPGTVDLEIGTPIPTAGLDEQAKGALAEQAREAIAELLR